MEADSLFRKSERRGMHFHGRKRSKSGVAGFVLSVLAVTVFLGLCVASAMAKGAAGEAVGALGLMVMLMCGISFWLSLKGLKEQDVYTRLPFAGLLLSGGMFVLLFCLYILGI